MKTKLTAVLVTETAKTQFVDLRTEFDLTEKQLVDLVLKQALRRKSELVKAVETFHAKLEAQKEASKAERLAQYKEKAAMVRKAKSAVKLKEKLAKLEGGEVEAE